MTASAVVATVLGSIPASSDTVESEGAADEAVLKIVPVPYIKRKTPKKFQCCGSGMFIPDPTFFHPKSRIRTVSIPDPHQRINPKKWFLSSRKYDPGCSSRIPDPDADSLPIPDPGVKKAPDPGSATLKNSPLKISVCLCLGVHPQCRRAA
jgi:hypothetical protein